VAYDNYNRLSTTKEPIMLKLVTQGKEVEDFRKSLVSFIARREIKERAFTCWLSWFDDNKEDYYITLNKKKDENVDATETDKVVDQVVQEDDGIDDPDLIGVTKQHTNR